MMLRQRGQWCAVVLLLAGLLALSVGCAGVQTPDQSDSRQVSGKELRPNSVSGGNYPEPEMTQAKPDPTQMQISTPQPTQEAVDIPQPSGNEDYFYSERYAYYLLLPSGWTHYDDDNSGYELFKGPYQAEYATYPNVTANVIFQDMPNFTPDLLDDLLAQSIYEVENTFLEFELLDSGPWFLNGNPGRMMHYTVLQMGVALEIMQIIGYNDSTVIIWTYCALPGQFDQHWEDFVDTLIVSFSAY